MNIGALVGIDFDVPVWLLLIVALMITYYIYLTWNFNIFKKMGIPGPKPKPLLGTLGKMFKEGVIASDIAFISEYGKLCGTFSGRQPVLLTTDLDIVREVFVKEFNTFPIRNETIHHPNNLESKMLTSAQKDRWRHIRNSLSPTFSAGKLKLMSRQINTNADNLLRHLEEFVKEDKMFEFKELSGCFTMDAIAGTAFGIQLDSHADTENKFIKMGKEVFKFTFRSPVLIMLFFLPHALRVMSRLGFTATPKKALEFFTGVVRAVLQQHEKQERGENFIQLAANALVKTPTKKDVGKPFVVEDESGIWTTEGLTEEDILANAVLFFLAGYETTANTLNFVAYLLAANPHVQERLIEEIDWHLNGREPKYEDLTEMHYLDNVISETLRMYPQALRLQRHANEGIEIKGLRIPKGMDIGICVWNIHYDPDYWPDPEKFDPNRFTPDVKAGRDPYCYLPFGHGPRNCIGMRLALMEMKICVIRILQKFRLVATEKTPIPMKLKKLQMIPEDGNWLKAQTRYDTPT